MNTYKFRAKISDKGVTGSLDGTLQNVPDGQTIDSLQTLALDTIHKTLPMANVTHLTVTKVQPRKKQFCASVPAT